jgi:hypothetical protein
MFPLANTGQVKPFTNGHPEDVKDYVTSDVYRLSASVTGSGWQVELPAQIVDAKAGSTVTVPVNAVRDPGAAPVATVRLTATSESDPQATATATCQLSVLSTVPFPKR